MPTDDNPFEERLRRVSNHWELWAEAFTEQRRRRTSQVRLEPDGAGNYRIVQPESGVTGINSHVTYIDDLQVFGTSTTVDERNDEMPLNSMEDFNRLTEYARSRGIPADAGEFRPDGTRCFYWRSPDGSTHAQVYLSTSGQRAEVWFSGSCWKNMQAASPDQSRYDFFCDIVKALTPEIPSGSVKVIIHGKTPFWTARRPTSPSVVRVGEKYFWKALVKTALMPDGTDQFFELENSPDIITIDATLSVNGNRRHYRYAHKDAVVYLENHRGDRVGYVHVSDSRLLEAVATGSTTRHGVKIYRLTNEAVKKSFQSYSTRIENVLDRTQLFRKASNDIYANNPATPFLGFELESVAPDKDQNVGAILAYNTLDGSCISKADGSLPSGGVEIVTVPATLDFWKEMKLDAKLESLREQGFRSYGYTQCGFHIHVSRNALSVLDLYKIERFVHNPDNKSFMVLVAGRTENSYSKFTSTRFNKRDSLRSGRPVPRSEDDYGNAVVFNYVANGMEYSRTSRSRFDIEYLLAALILDYQAGRIASDTFRMYLNNAFTWVHCEARGILRFEQRARSCYDGVSSVETFIEWVRPHITGGFEPAQAVEQVLVPPKPKEEKSKSKDTSEVKYPVSLKAKYPVGRLNSKFAKEDYTLSVSKTDLGRYDALNCANENTIEFRMFKGTMCGTRVLSYLEFVDALVRFVQQAGTKEAGSPEMFMRWLNSPFNRHRYNNLCAYLAREPQYAPLFSNLRTKTTFNQDNA